MTTIVLWNTITFCAYRSHWMREAFYENKVNTKKRRGTVSHSPIWKKTHKYLHISKTIIHYNQNKTQKCQNEFLYVRLKQPHCLHQSISNHFHLWILSSVLKHIFLHSILMQALIIDVTQFTYTWHCINHSLIQYLKIVTNKTQTSGNILYLFLESLHWTLSAKVYFSGIKGNCFMV